MPWAIFNRPSIQLGSLQAYLQTLAPEIRVTSLHPYLSVAAALGGELYQAISMDAWLCEALFAPIIFPQMRAAAKKLALARIRQNKDINIDFAATVDLLAANLHEFVAAVNWQDFKLVGFSACFNQLLPTLAAAKLIKAEHDVTIVLGGSQCVSDAQHGLLKEFSFIDAVIYGEGEEKLLSLCRTLQKGAAPTSVVDPGQLDDLNDLPMPDYSDYFRQQAALFKKAPFIPALPVEFSRGCWWGKCSFCNLNLQWCGYRAKDGSRMYDEIIALSSRYGSLGFCLTDNVLPVNEAKILFTKLAECGQDLDFFGEVRADQGRYLSLYRRGGLTTIQAGIEALSDGLLAKFKKGASVIDNLAIMKTAVATGIELTGNLITCFPGSSEDEVNETLVNLDFAFAYQPLQAARFFLGYGSPVFANSSEYGIDGIVPHPNYAHLFPKEILKGLQLLIKGYRGDIGRQKKLWRPVEKKIKARDKFHRQRICKGRRQPALQLRQGGDYIIIRQELAAGPVLQHRLRGMSARIYLACTEPPSLESLQQEFGAISRDKLLAFLDDLVKKRLLFRQGDKVLALAVA